MPGAPEKAAMLVNPSEIAAHIAELLSDPLRFIKGHSAKDKHGEPCNPRSLAAVAWCVEGALHHASAVDAVQERAAVYRELTNELGWDGTLWLFNDREFRSRPRLVAAAKRVAKRFRSADL